MGLRMVADHTGDGPPFPVTPYMICPRDPSRRCKGCDRDDFSMPTKCGQGDPVWRSRAWKEWVKRQRGE